MAGSLGVSEDDLQIKDNCSNCDEYQSIIGKIKNKIVESKSFEEKINLVELAPKSWSLLKIMENFGVSDYMARSARNNSDTSAVKIAKKQGKSFTIDIVSRVKDFYQSD